MNNTRCFNTVFEVESFLSAIVEPIFKTGTADKIAIIEKYKGIEIANIIFMLNIDVFSSSYNPINAFYVRVEESYAAWNQDNTRFPTHRDSIHTVRTLCDILISRYSNVCIDMLELDEIITRVVKPFLKETQ
jgi:hypothetical protein